MSLMSVKSYFGGMDGRVWLTKPLFSFALFKGIKANSVPLLLLLSLFFAFITSASHPLLPPIMDMLSSVCSGMN